MNDLTKFATKEEKGTRTTIDTLKVEEWREENAQRRDELMQKRHEEFISVATQQNKILERIADALTNTKNK